MRFSRRPLPAPDSSVDALSDEDRAILVLVWGSRANAEAGAVESFQFIHETLKACGAATEIIKLAERAIEDELWHSRICHRLASTYQGAELPDPKPEPLRVPSHAGSSASMRTLLHVVGQCCLNETTGSAFYEMCFSRARGEPARSGIRALLSDEVDHARIGWAHLASLRLSVEERADFETWLPKLIEANLLSWRARARVPERPALIAHGCPPYEAGDDAVRGALRDLILPGLARAGF